MAMLQGGLERVHHRIHHTFQLTSAVFHSLIFTDVLPSPEVFVPLRIRMEVLEGADQDISSLKSFTVKFCISNRAYYEGPASTLLLEDWLRKELASLRECTTEEIDAHLDRALINGHLALGALDSVAINFGERFSVTVAPHKVIELHKPLSFRVFLEGPYFRAIQ